MSMEAVLDTSLAALKTGRDSPARVQKSAADFEALLLGQMLKSARESGGGFIEMGGDGNDANSTMVELGEQQFAQALAANGGFGIAKLVVAGLTKNAH